MLYGYGHLPLAKKNIYTLQKNICYGNKMCTFGLLYHS